MNRREFIAALGLGAAAVAFGPEILASEPVVASGWTGTALNVGDVFTIAGQYATNPTTGKEVTGLLQYYVVTAVSDDSVEIHPSITSVGRRVSRSVVNPLYMAEPSV